MKKLFGFGMMAASLILFAISFFLFGKFLLFGPFPIFRLDWSDGPLLFWNSFLSALFFLQHSIMVRPWFRNKHLAFIPRPYQLAFYSIVASFTLFLVFFCWQPTSTILLQIQNPFRAFSYVMIATSIAVFIWSGYALKTFDPCGMTPIRMHLEEKIPQHSGFIVDGPYLWIRHPIYTFTIIFIWSSPDITSDRLLFNTLWSLWIIAGSYFEEKNMILEFKEEYRHYQKAVPMLIPWKGASGKKLRKK